MGLRRRSEKDMLTLIKRKHESSRKGAKRALRWRGLYLCSFCNKQCVVANLHAKKQQSCGCARLELIAKWNREHPSPPRKRPNKNRLSDADRIIHNRMSRRRKLRKEILKRYGLSQSQYENMLEQQHGLCAICGGVCASGKLLAIDHDHVTNKVRGLLCNLCNLGIGLLADNPTVIRQAIIYLNTSRPSVSLSDCPTPVPIDPLWRKHNLPPEVRKERKRASWRRVWLKMAYGLTEAEYNLMVFQQRERCAICYRHEKLSVDHDHESSQVRGLLCRECNAGIAKFKDNINLLCKAIDYLNMHNEAEKVA